MPDIDRIIEQLLSDRRISEGAAFSSRTFSDQPLIERGSDLKARLDKNKREREQRIAEREARLAAQRAQRADAHRKERPEPPKPSPQQQLTDFLFPSQGESSLKRPFRQALSLFTNDLPQPIRDMRKLERGGMPHSLAYGSSAAASLFYQQAKLMESYEDTYEYSGDFQQYYPTYASMTDQQLRGYFAWRTRVRAGEVSQGPLSFAFVYIYELLAGIGTMPGVQGLHDLRAFEKAWQASGSPQATTLRRYLEQWLVDYAVYHDIVDELGTAASTRVPQIASYVMTLVRAEHIQLRAQGGEPRIANPLAQGSAPTPAEVLEALGACGTYHLSDSRLTKAEPQLVAAVASDVFAALVTHCARRRKTDFVEGLFGYAEAGWHTMFSGAVYYEEERHPDAVVEIGPYERYTCKNGRWEHWVATSARQRNKDLGAILHFIDFELRQQLDYPYPLKQRKDLPKYVQKIVRDSVTARLAEREEAEKRRITIDRSQLASIRAAAAVTQEALLTDEERGIEEMGSVSDIGPMKHVVDSSTVAATSTLWPTEPTHRPSATSPVPSATHLTPSNPAPPPAMQTATKPSAPAVEAELLTPLEHRFVQGLLDGTPVSELLSPTDPFVSVVADTINEKFFDVVGDAVIEFDGDEPCLIEDYLDDIREVLAS